MIPIILGAIVVGLLLGLLGSGGSIATVPLLVYVVGHDDKQAIVESLAIVGCISAYGAIRRAIAGSVAWRAALWFAPSSVIGAWLGTRIGLMVPGSLQLVLLALLMLGSAVLMLRRSAQDDSPHTTKGPALLLAGLCVGVMTGVVGIGGGFLIVPAFVMVGGLTAQAATGTSLALIALNSATGFLGYTLSPECPEIEWPVILLFSAVGIVGAIAGQTLSKRISQKAFKRVFGVFLLVLAPFMILREAPDLLSNHHDAGELTSAPDARGAETD